MAGLAVMALAAPVDAQSVVEQIEAQLRDQGYSTITVSRTLLGRTQIEAASDTLQREIVLDPRTGEILRDYWQPINGASSATVTISNPGSVAPGLSSGSGSSGSGSGSNSGSGGSGSSGHGSGGSGSGSSGSGSSDDD